MAACAIAHKCRIAGSGCLYLQSRNACTCALEHGSWLQECSSRGLHADALSPAGRCQVAGHALQCAACTMHRHTAIIGYGREVSGRQAGQLLRCLRTERHLLRCSMPQPARPGHWQPAHEAADPIAAEVMDILLQVCGFESPKDAPRCCAYAPGVGRREIACGFASGTLRIFDASSIALLQVCLHAAAIMSPCILSCGLSA